MGTTNTRVWIVDRGRIVVRLTEQVGLRDAAREHDPFLVRKSIGRLLATACSRAGELHLGAECVLAAGMLTSPLGLREVPHLVAPVGEQQLAQALVKLTEADLSELPIYLVPGVRSGPQSPRVEELEKTDLLRGEETLIVGLLDAGVLSRNTTLLNVGSHWKAITIDERCRISRSFTTLSGELLHALQTQTVLASALLPGRVEQMDLEWFERGREFETRSGIGRALFSVRLLEQIFHTGPVALVSFLMGVLVGSDSRSMERAGALQGTIVITGAGAAPKAWQAIFEATGREHRLCDAETAEQALLRGLGRLFHLYCMQTT